MSARLTLRELMAAVAVLGVVLPGGRVHCSLGSFVGGVLSIAGIRTTEPVSRRGAIGDRPSPG